MYQDSCVIAPDTFCVYLDLDGVLNNSQNASLHPRSSIKLFKDIGDYVELDKLAKFQCFCQQTNASVVLISSWGISYRKKFKKLRDFLDINLVGLGDAMGGGDSRGRGVDTHRSRHAISHYLIIDDSDHFHQDKSHLCSPMGNVGLTDKDYERCWSIYNEQ